MKKMNTASPKTAAALTAARDAWNTIRVTNASATDKKKAEEAYKQAVGAYVTELGIVR